jgi:hypothetical protein
VHTHGTRLRRVILRGGRFVVRVWSKNIENIINLVGLFLFYLINDYSKKKKFVANVKILQRIIYDKPFVWWSLMIDVVLSYIFLV